MGDVKITIREIDQASRGDVRAGDGFFTADSKLSISVTDDVIHYTIAPVPPFEKRYPEDEVDSASYVNNPDKVIFIAYAGRQAAGQVRLRRYWNAYAYIEDIAVDPNFRKRGIGALLLRRAVTWARDRRFPGVMLETQNINVAACRLYERGGFTLGGFDRCLYHGLHPGTEEIALYWHLIFRHES